MRSRLVPFVFLATLVLALAVITWLAFRPRPPLVLGLVGSLSGRFAALGTSGRDGAILAVEELNAAGGVLGRRLELDVADDQGQGEACIAAYERFAGTGRRIVIGPFATGPATKALDTINRLGVLSIAPTVAGDNLAGRDDWFIRLYPSTREMGRTLGGMAAQDGVRHLAVIGDAANGPFLSTTVAGVRESPSAACLVEPVITFDSRAEPALRATAATAGDADGVLIIASSLDTAALAQRLRERQPGVRLYCASWAVSHELMANGGAALEGLRTVLPVAMHGAGWPDRVARYRARFGCDPTHVAILHDEAVRLVAAAIVATGSDDPAVVKAAIISGHLLAGAPAEVLVDATGDPRRRLIPHQVRGGVLVAE